MKLVVCLVLMLISAKECDKKKAQMANDSQTNTAMLERRMQEDAKVKYQAVSRGYFLEVTLEGNSIVVANNRDAKSVKRYDVSAEDARELLHLMSEIDKTTLPQLEAPSKAHQYDGAAIATLEITNGEEAYKTSVFDHGNPPKAIQALVKKMLSIKDLMEKQ